MSGPSVLAVVPSLEAYSLEKLQGLRHALVKDEGFTMVVVANGRSVTSAMQQMNEFYLTANENLGFGRAINFAVANMPPHDWILLVNDDLDLVEASGRIRTAIESAARAHEDVGLIYLHSEALKVLPDLRSVAENVSLVARLREHLGRTRVAEARAEACGGYRSFACVAISSDLWTASEGFDPRFPFTYEDADFVRRAATMGYMAVLAPVHGLRHRHSVTTSRRVEEVLPVTIWSALMYCRKWSSSRFVRPLLLLSLVIRLVFAPFTAADTRAHYRGIARAIMHLVRGTEPALPRFDES